jgi:hypothetical protein
MFKGQTITGKNEIVVISKIGLRRNLCAQGTGLECTKPNSRGFSNKSLARKTEIEEKLIFSAQSPPNHES